MMTSKFSGAVLAAVLAASSVSAQCTFDVTAQSGETCSLLASAFGITLAEFINWNPSVGTNCDVGLVVGDSYCVAYTSSSSSSFGSSSTGTTSSTLVTSTKSSTTTSSTSSAGPSPTQSGIPSDCDNYYLVKSGDYCSPIVAEFGITLAEFYAWNPAVGSSCTTLLAGYYVCVGIPGITTTPPPSTTTTSTATGLQPEQTGIISSCDNYYLVQSGDTCLAIATKYGITLAEFYAWNPAVGSTCSTLYAAYYVCVGIPGITTTAAATGPSPEQTGIASNCNKYYLVKSGDTCSAISATYGISLADFYAWNPAVGSTCATLDTGYYVCVDIPSVTPTTSTTATGPTPTQTGITSSCDKFYEAVSGDTCDGIVAKYSITLAEFYAWNPAVGSTCASLWLGYYYCIGV